MFIWTFVLLFFFVCSALQEGLHRGFFPAGVCATVCEQLLFCSHSCFQSPSHVLAWSPLLMFLEERQHQFLGFLAMVPKVCSLTLWSARCCSNKRRIILQQNANTPCQRTALETKLLILSSLLESALVMPGPVGKSLGCEVTPDLPEKGGQSGPSRQGAHRCTGRGLEQLWAWELGMMQAESQWRVSGLSLSSVSGF